jgi:hypothetical protein
MKTTTSHYSDIPNADQFQRSIGILHSIKKHWVSNEGTKSKPSYHVWVPNGTHCTCDSAYHELGLAVTRCNYLANTNKP